MSTVIVTSSSPSPSRHQGSRRTAPPSAVLDPRPLRRSASRAWKLKLNLITSRQLKHQFRTKQLDPEFSCLVYPQEISSILLSESDDPLADQLVSYSVPVPKASRAQLHVNAVSTEARRDQPWPQRPRHSIASECPSSKSTGTSSPMSCHQVCLLVARSITRSS